MRPALEHRTPRRKMLFVSVLLVILIFVICLSAIAHHAKPLLRARVVETLSTRFHSRVDLADLDVSVSNGLLVSGKRLRIYGEHDPNIHREGFQPLIGVDEFRFSVGVMSLLRSPMHVGTVYMKGLQMNIPPANERQQFRDMAPKGGKILIMVDVFHAEEAELVINTERPDKSPLEFDIRDLTMRDIGPDRPLAFKATLVNPKPIGYVYSEGEFGPFHPEDPRESPVQGTYTFQNSNLGTLKGIAGILSSTGKYGGALGKIAVDGQTDTPDFRLNTSDRPVPLKTRFHAVVDGASGDTSLQPVDALLLSTPIMATGFVVKTAEPPGHHIVLDVVIANGKIEDVLRLAVRTEPPVMTGTVRLQTKLDLPAGRADLTDRLHLKGRFEVAHSHFSNEKIQSKVDSLSMRSLGKPHLATDNVPDNVQSEMKGAFILKKSVLSFSDLRFQMPGTKVNLVGDYSLDGNRFDFRGHARFDAKLSQMVGGWKSVLLKPVDPFFRKNGAGAEIPVKITGTKSEPHFGLNFRDKDKHQERDLKEAEKIR